jgi:hypothetical protein
MSLPCHFVSDIFYLYSKVIYILSNLCSKNFQVFRLYLFVFSQLVPEKNLYQNTLFCNFWKEWNFSGFTSYFQKRNSFSLFWERAIHSTPLIIIFKNIIFGDFMFPYDRLLGKKSCECDLILHLKFVFLIIVFTFRFELGMCVKMSNSWCIPSAASINQSITSKFSRSLCCVLFASIAFFFFFWFFCC